MPPIGIFCQKIVSCVLLASLLTLGGCAGMKQRRELTGTRGLTALEKQGNSELAETPSIVKIKLQKDSFVVKEPQLGLPEELDRQVTAEFHNTTVDKILYTVGKAYGFNTIYQPQSHKRQSGETSQQITANSSTKTVGAQEVNVSNSVQGNAGTNENTPVSITFQGRLSDFLLSLSKASGYFIVYENDALVVKETEQFSVAVPSYPEMLKEVENSIRTLGGRNIAYDRFSAAISFSCNRNALRDIKELCRGLRNNASLVTMRVLLLSVQLNDSSFRGIDWSQLSLGYKGQALPNFGNKAQWATASNSSTSGSSGSSTVYGPSPGVGVMGTSTGASLFLESSNFSFGLVSSFLDSYGSTNILQNANVEAMSGTRGLLTALTETPYVSEISLTALTSQSTTTSQGVKTTVAKSGVELDITPYYSKSDGSLTIALKINVMGVNRYVTLSAGSQLGVFSQPETSKKTVETTLRMSPWQVAIIGGLVNEQTNYSADGLPFENSLAKKYGDSKTKEELVVVVKPSIIEFE